MRKLITILLVFASAYCYAQTNNNITWYRVQNVGQVGTYTGTSDALRVIGTNAPDTLYFLCSECTVDGDTVIGGAGTRKWRRFIAGGGGSGGGLDSIYKKDAGFWTYYSIDGEEKRFLDLSVSEVFFDTITGSLGVWVIERLPAYGTNLDGRYYLKAKSKTDSSFMLYKYDDDTLSGLNSKGTVFEFGTRSGYFPSSTSLPNIDTVRVKVGGSGGDSLDYRTITQISDTCFTLNRPNGTQDTVCISLNINAVDSIWRVPGVDSFYYTINGRQHALLDSTGGGTFTDTYINAATYSGTTLILTNNLGGTVTTTISPGITVKNWLNTYNNIKTLSFNFPGLGLSESFSESPSGQVNFGYSLVNNWSANALKISNYTLVSSDMAIRADASSGAITITLPASPATSAAQKVYIIKKVDNSANAVTVATTSGTIDGAATYTLGSQYKYVMVMSGDGTNWFVIGQN